MSTMVTHEQHGKHASEMFRVVAMATKCFRKDWAWWGMMVIRWETKTAEIQKTDY